MTLATSIAADATTVFLRTDDFAETVTYNPYNYPGEASRAARSIAAVVIRQDYEVLSEDGDVVIHSFEVHVHNHTTTGINSDEIDVGRDQITLPPRDGQTAEARTIRRIISQDAGMLVLECR